MNINNAWRPCPKKHMKKTKMEEMDWTRSKNSGIPKSEPESEYIRIRPKYSGYYF